MTSSAFYPETYLFHRYQIDYHIIEFENIQNICCSYIPKLKPNFKKCTVKTAEGNLQHPGCVYCSPCGQHQLLLCFTVLEDTSNASGRSQQQLTGSHDASEAAGSSVGTRATAVGSSGGFGRNSHQPAICKLSTLVLLRVSLTGHLQCVDLFSLFGQRLIHAAQVIAHHT